MLVIANVGEDDLLDLDNQQHFNQLKTYLKQNESNFSQMKRNLVITVDRDYWTGEENATQEEVLIQHQTYNNLLFAIDKLTLNEDYPIPEAQPF